MRCLFKDIRTQLYANYYGHSHDCLHFFGSHSTSFLCILLTDLLIFFIYEVLKFSFLDLSQMFHYFRNAVVWISKENVKIVMMD